MLDSGHWTCIQLGTDPLRYRIFEVPSPAKCLQQFPFVIVNAQRLQLDELVVIRFRFGFFVFASMFNALRKHDKIEDHIKTFDAT